MSEIILDTNIKSAKAEKPSVSKTEEKNAVSEILNASKKTSRAVAAPGIYMPGGYSRGQIVEDYNQVNLLETDDAKQAKLEMWIAKNIGTELMAKYPNREWGVGTNMPGRMIYIMCPSLSNTNAYYISMEGRSLLDLKAEAVRAAGEILERFGITRGRKCDAEQFDYLARDLRGDVISPDAAPGQEVKCLES